MRAWAISGWNAYDQVEASFTLDANLFKRHPDYLLRIRGDSMRDAGMLDGDSTFLAGHQR